eukprot:954354-Amphidinium_carterae.1
MVCMLFWTVWSRHALPRPRDVDVSDGCLVCAGAEGLNWVELSLGLVHIIDGYEPNEIKAIAVWYVDGESCV